MLWNIYMSKFGVSGKLGEWEEQMQGVEFELDGETGCDRQCRRRGGGNPFGRQF